MPSTTNVQLVDNSMRLFCVMLFSSNKAHDRHLNICAKSCVHKYCVQVQVLMSLYQGHAMIGPYT